MIRRDNYGITVDTHLYNSNRKIEIEIEYEDAIRYSMTLLSMIPKTEKQRFVDQIKEDPSIIKGVLTELHQEPLNFEVQYRYALLASMSLLDETNLKVLFKVSKLNPGMITVICPTARLYVICKKTGQFKGLYKHFYDPRDYPKCYTKTISYSLSFFNAFHIAGYLLGLSIWRPGEEEGLHRKMKIIKQAPEVLFYRFMKEVISERGIYSDNEKFTWSTL